MDDIDKHILRVLQVSGRMANNELADVVGLSPSSCLRRVRTLEADGVIKGYLAVLNPASVGYGTTVFCRVWLTSQNTDLVREFTDAIVAMPEVMECHLMAGDCDFLLRIVVPDLDSYRVFQSDVLTQLPSVQSVKTEIPLQKIKLTSALPV